MRAALDLAAYVLGLTVLLGVLLALWLAKDLLFGLRFKEPHPEFTRLPTEALDQVRRLQQQMQAAYATASAAQRRHLDVHLRRMQERILHVEQRTLQEHEPYYKAVSRRERTWRQWKALHGQVRTMSREGRARVEKVLENTERAYRRVQRLVQDEWERGRVRDTLMLDELRAIGLLEPDYVAMLLTQVVEAPPPEESAEQAAPPVAGAPAEPRAAEAGALAPSVGNAGVATDAAVPAGAPGGLGAGGGRLGRFVAGLFRRSAEEARGAGAWEGAAEATQAGAPAGPAGNDNAVPASNAPRLPASAPGVAPLAPAEVALHQADFADPALPKAGKVYQDPTFSLAGLPQGILRGADCSGTSFAQVAFTGRHRYLDCRFAGADLAEVTLLPQQKAHQFVRCDFSGANFAGSRLGYLLFHQCDLSRTRWAGSRLERVRFSACAQEDAQWDDAERIDTWEVYLPPEQASRLPGADPRTGSAESAAVGLAGSVATQPPQPGAGSDSPAPAAAGAAPSGPSPAEQGMAAPREPVPPGAASGPSAGPGEAAPAGTPEPTLAAAQESPGEPDKPRERP